MTRPLLSITNLSINSASGATLVDDVSFTVRRGETVGIVGESGSGKSLTALSIGGLLTEMTVTGVRRFMGHDLQTLPRRALRALRGRDLAYVFQDAGSAMLPVRSIGAQIVEQIRLHSSKGRAAARQQMRALLSEVGLDGARVQACCIHELSGGMRQRAMIAMAIACTPKLLIADEPTSALDVTVQAQILGVFRRLQDRGMALLLVTHDFGVVAQSCAQVIVMYSGNVVEYGPTADVLGNPLHPYTVALLATLPNVDHRREDGATTLYEIPGMMPLPEERPAGCVFQPRCGFAGPECAVKPALLFKEGRYVRCVKQ